jgi:hypothetical protein
LKNRADKNIKLVDGSISFRDLLGEEIFKIRLISDILYRSDQSTPTGGEWQVNTLEPSQMRLKVMKHEDVKPYLVINKVAFDNNSIWSAGVQ